LSGGTEFTRQTCRELGRPVCLVDAATTSAKDAAILAQEFVERHAIGRLNVAGPRASLWAGAQSYAHAVVRSLLMTGND
jgi:hypothetical protein